MSTRRTTAGHGSPTRTPTGGHPGRGEAGHRALDLQGLHDRDLFAAAGPAGPDGQEGSGALGRPRPVLDVPAPLAGDGGELGLGVDGDGVAGRLEHGQVAGGVGVGHALLEVEMVGRWRSRP